MKEEVKLTDRDFLNVSIFFGCAGLMIGVGAGILKMPDNPILWAIAYGCIGAGVGLCGPFLILLFAILLSGC